MEKTEIANRVKEIFISILKHDNFEMKDELSAGDVDGWDSLTHMLIIAEVEKKFSIKFKLKELNRMENIGSLLELIQSKVQ